jgi:HSP20 family protein
MAFGSLTPFTRRSRAPRGAGEDNPFLSLRQEMDRMFDDFARGWPLAEGMTSNGVLSPKVDVSETEEGLEITAELPGVEEKDIDLDLADDVLTLKAEHAIEREDEEKEKGRRYHVVERAQGAFMRQFALPFEVDADKVKAKFKNGVLTVSVPRAASAEKPVRRIKVNGG